MLTLRVLKTTRQSEIGLHSVSKYISVFIKKEKRFKIFTENQIIVVLKSKGF